MTDVTATDIKLQKNSAVTFLKLVNNRFKFSLYMLKTLPAAWFSGVRVKHADEQQCQVTVPYKWFSQNPFRSTYFACLSMAAEMSTGILAMVHVYKRVPAISMLVASVNSTYLKKATGKTIFTCNDGLALQETITRAVKSGEPHSFTAQSVGVNENGETVAEFQVTWTFKIKKVV